VVLCGIVIDHDRGVEATSDGDVAAHAVMDALLGAVAAGDLGAHFCDDDPRMQAASSIALVEHVIALIDERGYRPFSVDVTVIAESVRIGPHRDAMRASLSQSLGLDVGSVSVKATSTDGLGAIGRDEGIAATAAAVVLPTEGQ
jgi:2-C-methyl-D-erythritol 4-phosphate cytidylyltransferase/2-C-methyl-D-erythritol 2,4-cyclodiphosphate synthase